MATRHVAKGQPCSSEGQQTLTRKPPLGAWAEGRAPDHLLGPLLGDSFDSGIRGPGSGVNSICLGSIHTVRGSVLPAITNFLNKSQAEVARGRSVRAPRGMPVLPGTFPQSPLPARRLLCPPDPRAPSDDPRRGTEGASTLQVGKPRQGAEGGAGAKELPNSQAEHPGTGLHNAPRLRREVAAVPASGQRRADRPAGARSARQRLFHLNPPWTGQNNPSLGHCWAVTT